MKAHEIAAAAAALVGGDRNRVYGDVLDCHERIADVWNGILRAAGKPTDTPLDAHDVANLMEGLKIARRYTGPFHRDNYIDGSGYSGVAGEIKSRMDKEA